MVISLITWSKTSPQKKTPDSKTQKKDSVLEITERIITFAKGSLIYDQNKSNVTTIIEFQ